MVDLPVRPLISVRNVYKWFAGETRAAGLINLSFDVYPGKIVAFVGESGVGKSTLLRLIYGLVAADEGIVEYMGKKVKGPSEVLIPGHPEMRMVSQQFEDLNQYAHVWDNVASRLSNTNLDEKFTKTDEILKELRLLHIKDRRVVDLSGGEKQRVAIARALVTHPRVLLMDEPFNQVDAHFRDSLQEDIRNIVSKKGLTVLLVSHDPTEVMGLADYLIVLEGGEIVQMGDPLQVYESPQNAYVAQLLARSNVLEREAWGILEIESKTRCVAVHPEWIQLIPHISGRFTINTVTYRGFYKELLVAHKQTVLRVYCMAADIWMPGMRVEVHIRKWKPLADA